MSVPSLADRILAALAEAECDGPTVRADRLFTMLTAQFDDIRSELYALDARGLVRYTPGFVAGDVVVLTALGRAQPEQPGERNAGLET